MSREMIKKVTAEQLQDYLTCPNLYYFKYIDQSSVPTPAHKWMDFAIHEALIQTLQRGGSTLYCLSAYEQVFTRGKDQDGRDVDIDFKEDTPEKLLIKGRGILQLYTGSPWFRGLDLLHCHQKLTLHLQPWPEETLCFPCEEPSPTSVAVICQIDAQLKDHSLLDLFVWSRLVLEEDYTRYLRFGLHSLALSYLQKLSTDQSRKVRSDILIKTIQPKIQVVQFVTTNEDEWCFLKNLYSIIKAIEEELFFATPNILCANHCDYKRNCQSRFKGMIHADPVCFSREYGDPTWRTRSRRMNEIVDRQTKSKKEVN
jgi:hypothetical protein